MKLHMTCLLAVALAGLLITQLPAQETPTAEKVIERFVKATGGKKKYESVKTLTMRAKLTIPQANATGAIEMYFVENGDVRINVDLGDLAKTQQGINGKVAWEMSSASGNRLLSEEEAKRLVENINMTKAFDPQSVYESMTNVGTEQVNGDKCYKLEMKRNGSDELDVTYYSIETGLMAKTITTEPTPFGKIKVESTIPGYMDIDGLKIPATVVQDIPDLGITQKIEFQSAKLNEKIDKAVFEMPEEIKELL